MVVENEAASALDARGAGVGIFVQSWQSRRAPNETKCRTGASEIIAGPQANSWVTSLFIPKLPPLTIAKLKSKHLASLGNMAKSEIESWIASTSSIPNDSDSQSPGLPEWRRELVLSDWHEAMRAAQKRLFTSSTKARIQFLQEEILHVARFCGEQYPRVRMRHAG